MVTPSRDAGPAGAAATWERYVQAAASMPWRQAGRRRRYAVTAAAIGLTFVVTVALERVVPYFVGDLFYLVIGAISWWLGGDAALLALAFVAVACLTPETPFPSIDDVLYLGLFVLTALAMVHLGRLVERQAREASEANAAKDRFLDLVSHDLRGPLQAMHFWVKLLRLHPADPRTAQRACDVIDKCVRQQSRLVADLLDAARLRSGKLDLQLEPTDLHRSSTGRSRRSLRRRPARGSRSPRPRAHSIRACSPTPIG